MRRGEKQRPVEFFRLSLPPFIFPNGYPADCPDGRPAHSGAPLPTAPLSFDLIADRGSLFNPEPAATVRGPSAVAAGSGLNDCATRSHALVGGILPPDPTCLTLWPTALTMAQGSCFGLPVPRPGGSACGERPNESKAYYRKACIFRNQQTTFSSELLHEFHAPSRGRGSSG